MANSNPHLDKDQLLRAVIDEGDLPPALRRHVAACARCRGEKKRFERDLALLGRKAAQMTPLPEFAPLAPSREVPRPFTWRTGRWRPLAAMAAAAVTVFCLWWGTGLFKADPEIGPGPYPLETGASEQLMTEINALAENPLPTLYLDLLGETDPGAGEDFIQFLVPALDNQPISSDISWKGVALCTREQASPFC